MGITSCFLALALALAPPGAFAAFEEDGAAARSLGMGGAFAAVADDAQAMHYNPAGLARLRRPELLSSYGRLHLGLDDGSGLSAGTLAYAHPVRVLRGALGAAWSSFSLSGRYREDAWRLSYGRALPGAWAAGGTLKRLSVRIGQDEFTARDPVFAGGKDSVSAFGLDLGALWQPLPRLRLGLALADLNRPDIGFGRSQRLPAALRAGAAYPGRELTLALDLVFRDGDWRLQQGLEKRLAGGRFAARGGLGFGSRELGELAFGFGLAERLFRVDYAFLYPISGAGTGFGSHRLAVTIPFGAAPPAAQGPAAEDGGPAPGALERRVAEQAAELEALKKKLEGMRLAPAAPAAAPAPKPKPAAAPPPPAWPKRHTAAAGDNLKSLAERYYGDPGRWLEIYRANRRVVGADGELRPGTEILIPEPERKP